LLAERRPTHEQWRHKLLSRYRAHRRSLDWLRRGLDRRGAEGSQGERDGDGKSHSGRPLAGLVEDGTWSGHGRGCRGVRHVWPTVGLLEAAAGPADGAAPRWSGGVALLAPLDPLVWDRDLLRSLYDFDYVWEVYVPAARRRWGTTSCRSCGATGWWAGSSRGRIG
jgi:hypothetical protein